MGTVGRVQRRCILFRIMAVFGVGLLSFAQPLWAADPPIPKAADAMTVSPGGVDLRTGRYTADLEDLAIGQGSVGAIDLRRVTGGEHGPGAHNVDRFGQYASNWDFVLKQYRACQGCVGGATTVESVSVSIEGVSFNFYDVGTSELKQTSNASYARLVRTMVGSTQNYYTLTTAAGTVAVFQTMPFPGPGTTFAEARPLTVSHSDGTTYTFSYNGTSLLTVTSNAGYKLILEHAYASQPSFITKGCVVNLSRQSAASNCPGGVQTSSYGYSGIWMTSATDRTGAIWPYSSNFTSWGGSFTEQQFRPGETIPFVINTWGVPAGEYDVVVAQDFADGRRFTYDYRAETYYYSFQNGEQIDRNFSLGTGWTEGGTLHTSVNFGSNGAIPPTITPTPLSATDPLNRTYTWTYPPVNQWEGGALAQATSMPEGNSEAYAYDAYRNKTQVRQVAKPGSGLADLTTTSAFGNCAGFANLVACDKPTQTVDARGGVTDITYSPVHGQVLTGTAPADPGGVRAVTRYSYAQRSAWISDGVGGYVQSSPPIWMKTEERTCRTSATTGATCAAGSADEVVTAYDYGPDSGPNTLLLRGVAVTASGQTLRTCYAYDDYGRKSSETLPNANLSACP